RYARSESVVSSSTPAPCRSAASSTVYAPQSAVPSIAPSGVRYVWFSRDPTARTTHGPSPAPTMTWLVPAGQWRKSHCRSGRSAPSTTATAAPERTRESSWFGSPGSSTVRTTPSCGNTGLAPSRRGHRPSPCPSRQTASRALRTYHPSPAGRSPCSACSRGNSGTGIVLPVRPASSIPGLLVPADLVGVDTSDVREIDGQPLEANDVHHRVTRGHERRLTTELAESTHDVGRPLGSSAGHLDHKLWNEKDDPR